MVWVTGNGLEKACISRPGQLLHCIDVTGELPPMSFAEQTVYTTNLLLSYEARYSNYCS